MRVKPLQTTEISWWGNINKSAHKMMKGMDLWDSSYFTREYGDRNSENICNYDAKTIYYGVEEIDKHLKLQSGLTTLSTQKIITFCTTG